VGHVARLLEEAGVPTVVIAVRAFESRLRAMKIPRIVLTPHLMGRPLGAPGDSERQRATLRTALDLLEHTTQAGTVVHLTGAYRPLGRPAEA
jgi:hypothetical protein